MSALLLARAARLLGWPPDRWAQGWPELLTAFEIATLEACDETGNRDRGKRAAILALLQNYPPPADGELPGRVAPIMARQSSYLSSPTMAPGYPSPAPMVPAYHPATYRQWPARDWPPGPMAAAWLGPDEAAAPVVTEPATPQGEPATPEAEPAKREPRETEINRWLWEIWQAEGRPGGAAFFRLLGKYRGKPGSPIREWWQYGKDAGIEWETSGGAREKWARKTIQNKASEFKQTAKPSKP